MEDFQGFPKIARFNREVIVTEKIDGTNAQVYISDNGDIIAGSRNLWITPDKDNYGFAKWVEKNKEELLKLGPGRHFGEWWGQGIQRRYGLEEKRFSLFNVARYETNLPACCHLVPVLFADLFENFYLVYTMEKLRIHGSMASPGFMEPEGIVIYHTAANVSFKKTFEKDNGKGA